MTGSQDVERSPGFVIGKAWGVDPKGAFLMASPPRQRKRIECCRSVTDPPGRSYGRSPESCEEFAAASMIAVYLLIAVFLLLLNGFFVLAEFSAV